VETGGLKEPVLGQYIKCSLIHVQPVVQGRMQGSAFVCLSDEVCMKCWWIVIIFSMSVVDITPLEVISLFLCLISRNIRGDIVQTAEVGATPASFNVVSWNFVWYEFVEKCALVCASARSRTRVCIEYVCIKAGSAISFPFAKTSKKCEIRVWNFVLWRILHATSNFVWTNSELHSYEGWNFNSGNYLFTTDTK